MDRNKIARAVTFSNVNGLYRNPADVEADAYQVAKIGVEAFARRWAINADEPEAVELWRAYAETLRGAATVRDLPALSR